LSYRGIEYTIELQDTTFSSITAQHINYLIAGSNMLADDVDESDGASDWSDCGSVYSVGDVSDISDAEEEDDKNLDDAYDRGYGGRGYGGRGSCG